MIDIYSLKARIYPVVILLLPILLTGIIYSFQFDTLITLFASLGITGTLTYLLSQLGRDQGKLKEKNLWESWGGVPTTQLLRIKDETIDKHTKARCHEILQIACPVDIVPDLNMENSDCKAADDVYRAWTKYLISKTRNTTNFPLVFKENISYGFRRNLWGLRPFGMGLISFLLIFNYLFWAVKYNTLNLIAFPDSFKFSTVLLVVTLLFWIFVVTKGWVKIVAFSYAERLLEAVESIKMEGSKNSKDN